MLTSSCVLLRDFGNGRRRAAAQSRMPPHSASCIALSWALGAAALAAPVVGRAETAAEEPAAVTVPEVIVTAEKRGSNLQRTPVSVTALSGEALEKAQVRTLADVQSLVPSVRIGENDGYAQVTVRGIGSSNFTPGAESPVAINLNDVYISRPIAQLSGLYDVSTLEVLRGPQGTLYGRNATAGAVNITTNRPSATPSGYLRVVGGNFGTFNAEGAVGGPIIGDKVLVRLAAMIDRHDGYGKNLVTGNEVDDKDAWGVRGTVVIAPVSSLKLTVIAERYEEHESAGGLHYFGPAGLLGFPGSVQSPPAFRTLGGFSATNLQDVASPADPRFRLRTTALTGSADWSHGPLSVRLITGYRDQDARTFTPLDGGSVLNSFYLSGEPAHQFSQEAQIHYDTQRAHVTAGAYYFHEVDNGSPSVAPFNSTLIYPAFGLQPPNPPFWVDFAEIGGTIRTTAKAIFTQGSFEVVHGLTLTAGIRYSEEVKSLSSRNNVDLTLSKVYNFDPRYPLSYTATQPESVDLPSKKFSSTTPKFGVQYQLDPTTMVYLNYAKGFKSGGFDITTNAPAFQPEKLVDYEGGLKTTLFDRRVRANLSGFYYKYSDLQVQQVVGFQVITTNAAKAKLYGAELELYALPTDRLTLEASASYLHARYLSYFGASGIAPFLPGLDYSGNRMNNAPTVQAHVSGEYRVPIEAGEFLFRVSGDYSSRYYFTPENVDLLSQKPFFKADASVTYNSDRNWHVTAFVRNIGDVTIRTSGLVNSSLLGSPAQGAVAPPRTCGVEVGYRF